MNLSGYNDSLRRRKMFNGGSRWDFSSVETRSRFYLWTDFALERVTNWKKILKIEFEINVKTTIDCGAVSMSSSRKSLGP